MGLGTRTLCMRDVVNGRSGWNNSDQRMVGFTRTSSWPLSFAPLGLRPTNDQILTKKDADGKEKVSKSEDEWDSALIKTDTETAAVAPPATITTTEERTRSFRRGETARSQL